MQYSYIKRTGEISGDLETKRHDFDILFNSLSLNSN